MTVVDTALLRALESLSPAEVTAIRSGRATLAVQPVATSSVDPAQLGLYADPSSATAARARRPPTTPVPERDHGVDVAAAAARINTLSSPAAVEEYLQDPCFTAVVLKQLAKALGPTVAATGRTKAAVRRDIVAGTAGFRSRSAAMSGGAWA